MVLVHGGPFANIAHGCNSILATKTALKLADYVVTEAGFGADLGAEKFLDIKCREAHLNPSLVVLVATIKALKYHGGVAIKDLKEENVDALKKGLGNLDKHYETIKAFGLPCVVAINKFLTDTDAEVKVLMDWAKERGVEVSLSEVYAKGGKGGIDLANKVVKVLDNDIASYKPLYNLNDSIKDKVLKIAKTAYGAKDVVYSEVAQAKLAELENSEAKEYYVCMAKTPNSLTDDPKVIGRPTDFTISVKDIRISTGSRFVIILTGDIMTMPGLSKEPMATKIDMSDTEEVFGLM